MPADHPYTIFPLGDAALTIDFGNIIDENINQKVHNIFRQLKSFSFSGITDVVPAYASLTIHYNIAAIQKFDNKSAFETVLNYINIVLKENQTCESVPSKIIKVPVCYSEKYAPDIIDIVEMRKISVEEIIYLHTSKSYHVFMVGFLPGFPYLGEVDEKLVVSRKQVPRTYVPSGSVGIAGKQTGIYPFSSPGGWQIIGRTPIKLFDKQKDNPVLFNAGDKVEFYSITEDEFQNYQTGYS